MKNLFLLTCAFVSVNTMLLCHPSYAQQVPLVSKQATQSDSQAENLSVVAKGETIESLFARLGNSSNVVLACDKYCAPIRIQADVGQISQEKLRSLMAELIMGEWKDVAADPATAGEKITTTGRTELHLSEEAMKRRRRWWLLYQNARAQALQYWAANSKALMNASLNPETDFGEGENAKTLKEQTQQAHKFFNSLGAGIQQQIGNNLNEAVYSGRGIRGFSSSDESFSLNYPVEQLPSSAQQALRQQFGGASTAGASIRFVNAGYTVVALMSEASGRDRGIAFQVTKTPSPNALPVEARLTGLDHRFLTKHNGNGLSPGARELRLFALRTVWPSPTSADIVALDAEDKKVQAEAKAKSGTPENPLASISQYRLVDRLSVLMEATKTNYISDYYSEAGAIMPARERARFIAEYQKAIKQDSKTNVLKHELDKICRDFDLSWKTDEDVTLVRHNRWYTLDYVEMVPDELNRVTQELTGIVGDYIKGDTLIEKKKTLSDRDYARLLVSAFVKCRAEEPKRYYALTATMIKGSGLLQLQNGVRWAVPSETAVAAVTDATDNISDKKMSYHQHMFVFLVSSIEQNMPALLFYNSLPVSLQPDLFDKGIPLSSLDNKQFDTIVAMYPFLKTAQQNTAQYSVRLIAKTGRLEITSVRP